jgi:dTDP-4-amino-4,6-dideoxygalactose transaminase
MEDLPAYIRAKGKIADYYREHLSGIPGLQYYQSAAWAECTFWLSNMIVQPEIFGMDSRMLMKALSRHGIQTRPLWHTLHDLPLFSNCHSLGGQVAAQLYRTVLSLPSSAGLTSTDLERVCLAIGAEKIPSSQ